MKYVLLLFLVLCQAMPAHSFCPSGYFLDGNDCTPCHFGSYMEDILHRETSCIRWTKRPRGPNWIVRVKGTSVRDMVWGCEDGFIEQFVSLLKSSKYCARDDSLTTPSSTLPSSITSAMTIDTSTITDTNMRVANELSTSPTKTLFKHSQSSNSLNTMHSFTTTSVIPVSNTAFHKEIPFGQSHNIFSSPESETGPEVYQYVIGVGVILVIMILCHLYIWCRHKATNDNRGKDWWESEPILIKYRKFREKDSEVITEFEERQETNSSNACGTNGLKSKENERSGESDKLISDIRIEGREENISCTGIARSVINPDYERHGQSNENDREIESVERKKESFFNVESANGGISSDKKCEKADELAKRHFNDGTANGVDKLDIERHGDSGKKVIEIESNEDSGKKVIEIERHEDFSKKVIETEKESEDKQRYNYLFNEPENVMHSLENVAHRISNERINDKKVKLKEQEDISDSERANENHGESNKQVNDVKIEVEDNKESSMNQLLVASGGESVTESSNEAKHDINAKKETFNSEELLIAKEKPYDSSNKEKTPDMNKQKSKKELKKVEPSPDNPVEVHTKEENIMGLNIRK